MLTFSELYYVSFDLVAKYRLQLCQQIHVGTRALKTASWSPFPRLSTHCGLLDLCPKERSTELQHPLLFSRNDPLEVLSSLGPSLFFGISPKSSVVCLKEKWHWEGISVTGLCYWFGSFPSFLWTEKLFFSLLRLSVCVSFLSRRPARIRGDTKLSMDNATYNILHIPAFVPDGPAKSTLCAPPAPEIDAEEYGASRVCQGYSVTLFATTHGDQQLLATAKP